MTLLKHPTIPFVFEGSSRDFEEGHLDVQKSGDNFTLRWPLIGVELTAAKQTDYYDVEQTEALNGGAFKNWNLCGFSIGTYHEFFCYPLEVHAAFLVSGSEVSFGYATPLVATLYDRYHDNDYFDEWDTLTTVRILGAEREQVEAVFINACFAYQQRFAELPRIMSLEIPDEWLEEPPGGEEGQQSQRVFRLAPAVGEITPLRFHYNGLVQVDPAAACLYFYRVLEYFAFLAYQKEIGALRHDLNLSDVDFTKRVIEIAYKDDKGPILQLVNRLADVDLLAKAAAAGVVTTTNASILGGELYNFRNAIVHGKHAGGYIPETNSVISGVSAAATWRPILQALAERALHRLGRKIV